VAKGKFEELEDRDPSIEKPLVDPGIAEVLRLCARMSTHQVYLRTFVSKSAIRKLRRNDDKATRRPQHLTLSGIAAAAGYEYRLQRKKTDTGGKRRKSK